ncbi:hypothetical protein [Suttonella ornithocola]|uniref:hypothetical protein n=1 Tax=Suttonella ornithocola TaxID=279832 RepID=UPI003CCC5CA9
MTSAAWLIQQGYRVSLIEALSNIGEGTSHANNALLTTSFVTPLATSGISRVAFIINFPKNAYGDLCKKKHKIEKFQFFKF